MQVEQELGFEGEIWSRRTKQKGRMEIPVLRREGKGELGGLRMAYFSGVQTGGCVVAGSRGRNTISR